MKIEDIISQILIEEKRPGLWANINAKKQRGEKASHGNSKAFKDAVAAGKDLKKEVVEVDKIECGNCDWSWDIAAGGDDPYTCHKCGHDNTELEEGFDFNLTNKEVDPETGAVSHTVVYTPMITLQREVEELYEAFKRTLKQYPEDQKLEKFFDVYASFKRQFKTHVNRKYNK